MVVSAKLGGRSAARPRLGSGAAAAMLALLIVAAYGTSVGNGFVHDDSLFMADARVQSVAALPRLFFEPRWGFGDEDPTALHMYYRPLEPLPYAAAHLFGGRPWASHLLNLLFHLLNALLVFAIARRLTSSDLQGAFAAALFAVYPAYSEAILWPAALGGLGALACTLAILLLAMRRSPATTDAAATAALYLGAMWFKETGILAPLYVALHDQLFRVDRCAARGGAAERRWRRYLAFVPPLAVYAILRNVALGDALPRLDHMPFSTGALALEGLASLQRFAGAFLSPFSHNFHHDFAPASGICDPLVWQGALLLALGVAGILTTRRRQPAMAFAIAAMFVAAGPYLIPHKPQDNVFAERYLYDVGFGAALAAALVAGAVWRRLRGAWRGIAAGAAAASLAAFVVADLRRAADWRDDVTLFRATIASGARAEIIRVNLAVRLHALGHYAEGIAVLEELVSFDPDYRGAWFNLGLLYQSVGRDDDAIAAYRRARASHPRDVSARLNLGVLLDQRGERDAALQSYFRVLAQRPRDTRAWYNLAVIALEEGQLGNARRALGEVLAARPGDPEATALAARANAATRRRGDAAATARRCELARRALDAGRRDAAIARLRAAAWRDELAPLPHQYLANLYYLGGELGPALHHQRRAVELAPDNQLYRDNLAALEAAVGGDRQDWEDLKD